MKKLLCFTILSIFLLLGIEKNQAQFSDSSHVLSIDSNLIDSVLPMKKIVYLLHGQGADHRSFKNLQLDTSLYTIHYIQYHVPAKHNDLASYALKLSEQIDTTKEFYLIGVSLGGMIAVELNELINPQKVIIISSAKSYKELPFQYKFQRKIALYKIFPAKFIKAMSFVAQPLFEPDRKLEKQTCVAMLSDKDEIFLKRSIAMIINWERDSSSESIIHIHGTNDHTIPIKNLECNYVIKDGSHMMILTRTNEIQAIIESVVKD